MLQRKLFRKCVPAYQGIGLNVLSKVSLTLELPHILPNHKGRGKRNNSVLDLQQPPRRAPLQDQLRVRRNEPRDFTIHCLKTCLLLTAWYF